MSFSKFSTRGHAHSPEMVDQMVDALQAMIDECDSHLEPIMHLMDLQMAGKNVKYDGREWDYYFNRKKALQDAFSTVYSVAHPYGNPA